jgi:hypothetical protein
LKKKTGIFLLDDTQPVPQVLNQSAGAHTITNTSAVNYSSLVAQAVQSHVMEKHNNKTAQ